MLVSQVPAVSDGGQPELQSVLVDLRAGGLVNVDGLTVEQPVVWNGESTFAALLVGANVHVFDRELQLTVPLDGVKFRSIGTRLT